MLQFHQIVTFRPSLHAARTQRDVRFPPVNRASHAHACAMTTYSARPVDPAVLAALDDAFSDPEVALVHVRAVEYGCYQFEVRRS
ncbi:hypothetical protein SXANM310S_06108 [Streptomyces xanthochromogenes]